MNIANLDFIRDVFAVRLTCVIHICFLSNARKIIDHIRAGLSLLANGSTCYRYFIHILRSLAQLHVCLCMDIKTPDKGVGIPR